MKNFKTLFVLIVALAMMVGCNPNVKPENHAPTFTIDLPASFSAKVNVAHEFTVTTTDADNDPVSYTWQESSNNGTSWSNVGSNSNKYSFVKASTGTWKLRVSADDGMGGSITSVVCNIPVTNDPSFNASLDKTIVKSTALGEVKFTTNGNYSEGAISLAELYYTNADGTPNPSTPFASIANPTLPWDKTMNDIHAGSYIVRSKLTAVDNTTKWSDLVMFTIDPAPATYSVIYNGNGNTSGSVPIDSNSYVSNSIVTIKGNEGTLAKPGYTFNDWNTSADGNGTPYKQGDTFSITGNMTLYAQWAEMVNTPIGDVTWYNSTSPIFSIVSPETIDYVVAWGSNNGSMEVVRTNGDVTWYNSTSPIFSIVSPETIDYVVAWGSNNGSMEVVRTNGDVTWYNSTSPIFSIVSPETIDYVVAWGSNNGSMEVVRTNGDVTWYNSTSPIFSIVSPETIDYVVAWGSNNGSMEVVRTNGDVTWYNSTSPIFSIVSPETIDYVVAWGSNNGSMEVVR